MGARMLRKWMVLPLKDRSPIEERLNTVEFFIQQPELREKLLANLKQIGDLERLISKVAVRRINPREMNTLKRALNNIQPIQEALRTFTHLKKYADQLHPCEFLLEKIETELREDPPIVTNQGNMIKSGVDPVLDEYHGLAFSGKDYLVKAQNREIERTGITSLKISYNKVFGYYLEVTNTHKDRVPTDWIRKQTLVNAERYITPELKEYEEKILSAEDKISVIESRIFNDHYSQRIHDSNPTKCQGDWPTRCPIRLCESGRKK
jgi:DNA mismatch repair protein MutS